MTGCVQYACVCWGDVEVTLTPKKFYFTYPTASLTIRISFKHFFSPFIATFNRHKKKSSSYMSGLFSRKLISTQMANQNQEESSDQLNQAKWVEL